MNEPAFPNEGFNGWGEPFQGMTLRDYFAAKAMQAFCTTVDVNDPNYGALWEPIAKDSYEMADAMMKVRKA
jgi:hypothetical protein